jgi:hypothetical protein
MRFKTGLARYGLKKSSCVTRSDKLEKKRPGLSQGGMYFKIKFPYTYHTTHTTQRDTQHHITHHTHITQQSRAEQNRTEQNKTEQSRT